MGGTIINIRYADNTVIIVWSKRQQLIDTVMEESEVKGLFPKSTKSFIMVFSKSDVISTCKIILHGNIFDQVIKFVTGKPLHVRWQVRTRRTTENNYFKISSHIIGKSSQQIEVWTSNWDMDCWNAINSEHCCMELRRGQPVQLCWRIWKQQRCGY